MDFELARFNMVEQQIRPWEVLNPVVLALLFHVKREDFVREEHRAMAFTDVELPLTNGSLMLQPKQEARMVQDLELDAGDKVLEIGTGSGYVTALLASLAGQVISLDIDAGMLEIAALHLKHANIKNVTLIAANGLQAPELAAQGPYDAIFVGGSVPVLPESLKNLLAIGGRMVIVAGDEPAMSVLRIRRETETSFSQTTLYETCIPRLQGCEAIEPERFIF